MDRFFIKQRNTEKDVFNIERRSTKDEREIAREIGYFYKNTGNREDELRKVNISLLKFNNGIVTILMDRPGIFIGKRGENIDALRKYLNESEILKHSKIKIESINIIESDVDSDLYLPWRVFDNDY